MRARLQPWNHLDEQWMTDATVIVVGTLREGSYPCIFHDDGSSDMPLARTIMVSEVLRRGPLQRESFDFNAPSEPSLAFPTDYVEGRRYLVFLRPSDEATRLLADPEQVFTVWNQLGSPDLVAMIDLDESEPEAEARRNEVATWQRRSQLVLDSAAWQRVRAATNVDTEQLATVLHALREARLPTLCSRDDVQQLLGPADESSHAGDETSDVYFVSREDHRSPRPGVMVARVELTYDASGAILEYSDDFEIHDGGAFRRATYEEKRSRGLTWVGVNRRRGSPCPSP